MNLPVPKLVAQIKAAHQRSIEHSRSAIQAILECGRLLKSLKLALGDGETWVQKVAEIGIAKRTADRYIAVAAYAAKNPAKTNYLLEQGATLVDLYRAFDLVKPVVSGAYDPNTYQQRKANDQLELDFSYEEFVPHLRSLTKARNVEELSPTTLQRLRAELVTAQQRIDAVLAEKGAINLEKHQP